MSKYLTKNESIGQLVREAETAFISGEGTLMSKYVVSDLYSDISKIYAYLESKHTSGEKDTAGRDKPFFNIVVAARNIYYRATDIDRKNVKVRGTKTRDMIPAFLATVHLQNWMRKDNFGQFLNDWGLDLAGFNSSVVKFVESEGQLHSMVVPWSRLIVDPINFDANPKIEILELTEAELYSRIKTHGYDAGMVEKLCDAVQARELTDRQKQDRKTGYIKLYEVHLNGELELLTGKESDSDTYAQQMHVVSFVASKEEGKFDDFTLVSGREDKDPYMLTSLIPATDGSISLNGSVKNLFQSQWMMNHAIKAEKDLLDISKIMFQTADPNYVGRNVLNSIQNGDIMVHAANSPLTQINNTPNNLLVAQHTFSTQWKALSSELVGISEAMLGSNPPAGSAWRQTATLLQENHSLFELMTENKGLAIEQMLRRFVIPFLKKQMNTSEEIAATLEARDITKIDSLYIPAEAIKRFNAEAVNKVLALDHTKPLDQQDTPKPYNPNTAQQSVQTEMTAQGNQRFFAPSDISTTTWKEVFKDLEWELEVDITGEGSVSKEDMDTLTTVLQTISTNPRVLSDPNAKLIFNRILSMTGAVSPLELAEAQPFVIPPMKRFTEAMDYKDVPEDIKRQMEEQQGFQPSQIQTPPPTQTPATAPPTVATGAGLPVNK